MVNAVKKLTDIAFEEIASFAMFMEMIVHEAVQPVHGKQRTLVLPAGSVIIDQMRLEIWCQHIIAEAVLQDTIPLMPGVYFTHLGIMNGEVVIT